MAANSFAEKLLRVTFTLSTNAVFEGTGGNTLVLSGLRTLAVVRGSGFPAWPEADLAVYGMRVSDMNALSSLASNVELITRNSVQIEANSGAGWSTVFNGQIVSAYVDYSGAPEVCLRVQCRALYLESIQSSPAVSYPGPTDAATMLSNIAAKTGYTFENNGVTAQLSNPYCAGTVGDQIKQIVQAIGCEFYVEGNVLAVAPVGTPRNVPSFTLSPTTGLVGYPVADSRGYLSTRALFNPAFRFGGPVTIAGSDVVVDPSNKTQTFNARANGNWYIGAIQHTLEAVKFGGAWFTDMLLQPLGTQPVAP